MAEYHIHRFGTTTKWFFYLLIFFVLTVLVNTYSIIEPETYEAKLIPDNFQGARKVLGYDHFQKVPAKRSEPKYETKSAWETYDTPDIQYNF